MSQGSPDEGRSKKEWSSLQDHVPDSCWEGASSQLPFHRTHCLAPPLDRQPPEGRTRPSLEHCDVLGAQHRAWHVDMLKLLGEEEPEPRALSEGSMQLVLKASQALGGLCCSASIAGLSRETRMRKDSSEVLGAQGWALPLPPTGPRLPAPLAAAPLRVQPPAYLC